ncbi:hypothetical protein Lal_00019077 [Lupinus albus]|uniref:Uncharacterized protein n=1 Tax=Lupinus albus TaxID=3870 RepID=A0A6A4R3H2_LUPAL|nr:hypothetical protein Lalb_Chr01g0004641 [Lupinus albus]KAF1898956.1 hypothetical protein Lal_00019077 [Lupinus albus]
MEASRDPKQASRDPKQAEEEEEKLKQIIGEDAVKEIEECKTPTGSRNKIPTVQICPPTPRKKMKLSLLIMKKSSTIEFKLLIRDKEVVLSFFPSMFQLTRVHTRCGSI